MSLSLFTTQLLQIEQPVPRHGEIADCSRRTDPCLARASVAVRVSVTRPVVRTRRVSHLSKGTKPVSNFAADFALAV
jgi:hypothetical protein